MDLDTARKKYEQQKRSAASRGIEWGLTFEQWLDWWGEDLDRRGVGTSNLQMQRPADRGPYAIGNIRKGTPRDNMKTAGAMRRLRETLKEKARLEQAMDSSEPVPSDYDDWIDLDSDENELQQMFGVSSSAAFSGRFVGDKQVRRR